MKALAWFLALIALLAPARAVAGEDIYEEAAPAAALETDLGAKAYCLIERTTGRVLFARNENERLPMASTTKVMTALLAVENCAMDEIVTAGPNAAGVPGTSIYLSEGESLSMRQMLLGLMLRSGNDAAVAIAEHIDGSAEAFAERMNGRARELGADAVFVTPNGLDAPGHGASALAMARIAAAGLEIPEFREIVGTKSAVIPWAGSEWDRALANKNRLLREYPGATGVKTGYTSKAGRCLVFSAERDGMELVGAVLNCYTWFDSAEKLLDAGCARYSMAGALVAGEEAARVPVLGGREKEAALIAKRDLAAPVAEGESWRVELDLPEWLEAPIASGQEIGTARLMLADGTILAEAPLAAARTIERNDLPAALGRVVRLWELMLLRGRIPAPHGLET